MDNMTDLLTDEFRRYGRQMIIPEVGKAGQLRLKNSSVLVIGAGGLGCPAIAYLAGAGIGTLGIADADTIDISNCHRQILHKCTETATLKVESAKRYVEGLNSGVRVVTYAERCGNHNAFEMISPYDIVLDCTDNQATRYLISDVCVLLGIVLVSGSALKTEGQLAIFNHCDGPCYRCLFPVPTPVECVQSCGEAGILGPVVGVIGTLQALEVIKLILQDPKTPVETTETFTPEPFVPKLTLFSAFGQPQFRAMNLRKKRRNCAACSTERTISRDSIISGMIDYSIFCPTSKAEQESLTDVERLDAAELQHISTDHVILDIRDRTQFGIVKLSQSVNVPLDSIDDFDMPSGTEKVLVVCRTGHDSQSVVRDLQKRFPSITFQDLKGGLHALSKINPHFPMY